ncbi:putative zinc finger protein [Paecilomyces variotii]|uniref:Putative zinc finger protein n=1 Tax=Byssochlamys spectabilis TaxID=264951 RepID=A0A443HSU5_BYSSP|nr:putative zinc finger protein [Paecilomyces variotii]RWQ94885.1 putative zinc finger protein [Paecilomyces variotii]
MAVCDCGSRFVNESALIQHRRDKLHKHEFPCSFCDRSFRTLSAVKQHKRDKHTFKCAHCNRIFRADAHLSQHQRSTGHCYCGDCDKYFDTTKALDQHLRSHINEANQFHCCDCDRDFSSERALEQHLTDKVHTIVRSETQGLICEECGRKFKNKHALKQHKTSLIHQPISNLECLSKDCRKRFPSPSALLHHLESGLCVSGTNRHTLNALIQKHDQDRLISNTDSVFASIVGAGEKLQGAGGSASSTTSDSDWDVIYTPSDSGVSTPAISEPGSAPFKTHRALQQHMESPAHAPRIFHCPVLLAPVNHKGVAVQRSFSTLSGLAQHLESGACKGGKSTFRNVARYVEDRLKELGWKGVSFLTK